MALAAALKSRWGGVMARGVLAVVVGVLALASPVAAFLTLALLFGCFAIVEGTLAVYAGLTSSPREGGLVALGAVGVLVGLVGVANPGLLALSLVTWIGVWAIARGVLEIVLAIRLRKEIQGEGYLMAGGAVSILFGLLLVARPLVGVVAHGVLFGIYAVVLGAGLIALALRLRKLPVA